MRRTQSPSEMAFQQELDEFFAAHSPQGRGLDIWLEQAWCEALRAQGWSTPGWPKELGGPGFSETEKFLWYRTCHAQIEQFCESPGVAVVGPLLGRLASRDDQARWLPGIRDLAERWCIALAPHDPPTVQTVGGASYLEGRIQWVLGDQDSQWLLGLAERHGADGDAWSLFVCPLHLGGVVCESHRTLAGDEVMHLEFDSVPIVNTDRCDSGAIIVCELASLDGLNLEGYLIGRSALSRAQLELVDQQIAQLSDADDLIARRDAILIEVLGLEAMELRYLDALKRGLEVPFSSHALALKGSQLEARVGSLLMDSFGYYALPYPDLWLNHNEGEVGPESAKGARATTEAWLRRSASENYASVSQDIYVKLAREENLNKTNKKAGE